MTIKIKSFIQTCGACPSQWEGETTEGGSIYIRFRFGCFSVDLDGFQIYYTVIGNDAYGGDGVMDTEKMQQITAHILDWACAEEMSYDRS